MQGRLILTAHAIVALYVWGLAGALADEAVPEQASGYQAFSKQYCGYCHNETLKHLNGEMSLDEVDLSDASAHGALMEKMVMKLRAGAMPPVGFPRPDTDAYDDFAVYLETVLNDAAVAAPNPGRPALFRLNRTEYATVIRELLALDIDVNALLPPDNSSFGFDNIADVLGVSPALMEGYLAAADRVSAIAVGDPDFAPEEAYYRISSLYSQDKYIEGMPLGSRGGTRIRHFFPIDGTYEINTTFLGNSLEAIRGLQFPHQYELAVDGERIRLIKVGGLSDYNFMMENSEASKLSIEKRARARVKLTAGIHEITATFLQKTGALEMNHLQPYEAFNYDPVYLGGVPSVQDVTVRGPFDGSAPSVETASHMAIFTCEPTSSRNEARCARKILARLARLAYRRPVNDTDVELLMTFYAAGREAAGTFDGGIQLGLRRILASPEFVFRFEQEPDDVAPGQPYRISDLELASRLSFFLWSSIPDDELIDLAARDRLSRPDVLEHQVRRMLADPRSQALVTNFAGQWLHLRKLGSVAPDARAFPDYDQNLQDAFLQETSLFVESIMREDRNVMDLMTADYTFLNPRLARHYGVKNVTGTGFRRVEVTDDARRGLLGHGSILTVTSFSHRTSPVVRGKWILENVMGAPPPAPPDNVPALTENDASSMDHQTMRERLAQHRANPTCAVCHNIMDPIGFSLETFDGIGAWRDKDAAGVPIDASGQLASGDPVDGVIGLRTALTARPEQFVGTFTEKMFTYALGRGLEYYDLPTVRDIVKRASEQDYRFSSIVLGVVNSQQFQLRRKAGTPEQPVVAARTN